jgi:hypothetical protein
LLETDAADLLAYYAETYAGEFVHPADRGVGGAASGSAGGRVVADVGGLVSPWLWGGFSPSKGEGGFSPSFLILSFLRTRGAPARGSPE